MNPTPAGWPRMSQSIYYQDPAAAIDWLCRAFGFAIRLKVEDGEGGIVHSELTYGDGLIMVGGVGRNDPDKDAWQALMASPRAVAGRVTQSVCVFVDDVDAHCAIATEAGATIMRAPVTNDHGDDYWTDRSYGCLYPEGHLWWFMQRLRSGPST